MQGLLTRLDRHDSKVKRQKQEQHQQHAFKSYLAVFVDVVMHDWPKLLALLLDIIANVKIPVGVSLPAPLTMLSVALEDMMNQTVRSVKSTCRYHLLSFVASR